MKMEQRAKNKQCQRILKHFETHDTLNQREALNLYGIARLSARISELRSNGYDIETKTIQCENQFGEKTHYAEYVFKGE